MDAIEQSMPEQPRDGNAEQRFGRRRNELHGAVAAVARDHIAHVPGQQAVALFLDASAARRWCAPATRRRMPARRIERRRQRRRRPSGVPRSAGLISALSAAARNARTGSARRRKTAPARTRTRPTRREADSAASSGTTTSQTAAKDSMPPVVDRHRSDQSSQRQRRQHMGALITAGARQEPGQQNGRDQPGESRDLERAGRAAHGEIDRKRRKRRKAAEQSRRHEGTMPRPRQRIITRRGMQQGIEAIADDIQHYHGFRASACSSTRRAGSPLVAGPPCQSEIKRTLRQTRPVRPASIETLRDCFTVSKSMDTRNVCFQKRFQISASQR